MEKELWLGLVDTERMVRYYSELSDELAKRHRVLRVIMLVSASSASATLLLRLPAELSGLILLVVAVVTAWNWTSDYQAKSVAADLMCQQYRDLAIDWRLAWYGTPSIEEVTKLRRRHNTIGAGYPLATNHDINQRVTEEVYDALRGEFAI